MKEPKPFYRSAQWKKKRAHILRRDRYLCQIAKRYGKNVDADTVHHIYPLEEYPEYALCDWNLISVSMEVNNRLHDRKTGELTALGRDLQRRTPIPGKGIPPPLTPIFQGPRGPEGGTLSISEDN